MTIADDTEGLAPNLPALRAHLVPGASVHLIGPVAELARKSDDLGDDQLSHTARVGKGRVENSYAMIRCELNIHLVRANAETTNDEQVLRFSENLGCQLGLGSNANDVHISRKGLDSFGSLKWTYTSPTPEYIM